MLAIYKGFKGLGVTFLVLPEKLRELGSLYEDHNNRPLPNSHHDDDGSDGGDEPNRDGQDSANKSPGPPAPERSTKAPARGNGKGRAGGKRQANIPVTRGAPGQQKRAAIGGARTRQKRQLEGPSEPPKPTKRTRVEISPWKWGPKVSSNDQVNHLKRYRAHMRSHGFPVGSDRETTQKEKTAKPKMEGLDRKA
ncbi:MAG: hypothetical protein Q9223_004260 [Gallowayella weberi]